MAMFALPFSAVFSQEMQVTISAGNNSIIVFPDNEDSTKLLVIDALQSSANKAFTIHVTNDNRDKDWKRSFAIYDSADNVLHDFVLMKDGNYCIKLSQLATLHTEEEYFIYTVAIPKDPQKAMLVKVARTLVCKFKIR